MYDVQTVLSSIREYIIYHTGALPVSVSISGEGGNAPTVKIRVKKEVGKGQLRELSKAICALAPATWTTDFEWV